MSQGFPTDHGERVFLSSWEGPVDLFDTTGPKDGGADEPEHPTGHRSRENADKEWLEQRTDSLGPAEPNEEEAEHPGHEEASPDTTAHVGGTENEADRVQPKACKKLAK